MNLDSFTGPGSTPSRRRFWDKLTQAVIASQKKEGKNVSVAEHQGMGTIINVSRGRGSAPPPDCTSCNDLPPTNPSGPPVHINITRTLSGTCGTGTLTGTVTYDLDLGFDLETEAGHTFCVHNIFDNGFGAFWTGHFFCNGSPFDEHGDGSTQGFNGLLGRDVADCTWWLELGAFAPTSCGGCGLGGFTTIFEMIAGAGDPSGVYTFSQTSGGFTFVTVVTIT